MENLTEKQQDALRDFVETQFDNLKKNRSELEDKWRTRWKLYSSYVNKTAYPYISNYFQPETYSLCKKKIAKILEYMFSTGRIVEVLSDDNSENGDKNAQANEDLMLQQFNRMKLQKRLIDIMGWAVPLGTAFAKVRWQKTVRNIKASIPVEGVNRVEAKSIEKVIYDDPTLDPISPWNIYIDRAAESIEDIGGLCHTYVLNEIELRQKKEDGWINTDLQGDRQDDDTGAENLYSETDDDTPSKDGVFKPMAIVHYWGTLNKELAEMLDGKEGDEFEIAYNRDRRYLHFASLNSEPHGLRPFLAFRIKSDSGRFYGEGEVEAVKDSQFELNDTCNWMNDLMSQLANPTIIHTRDVSDEVGNFVFGAGGRLEVDDISQVQINYPKQIPSDFYHKIEMSKSTMESVMGMHRYEQGAAPARAETASGIMMLQQAAQSQHALEVAMIEDEALERMAVMMVSLNQSNILEERIVGKMGLAGEKEVKIAITPEDIAGTFKFRFLGVLKQKHLMTARQNFPMVYDSTKFDNKVNHDVMLRGLFESMGIQDPSKYLTDPNEDRRLAAMENTNLLLMGEIEQPQVTEDHETHMAIHETLMPVLQGIESKAPELQILQQHISDHMQFMTGGTPTARQQGTEKKGTNEKGTGGNTPEGVGGMKAEMNQRSS